MREELLMSETETAHERFDDAASVLLLAPSEGDVDDEACIDLLTPVPPDRTNVLSVTVSRSAGSRLELWKRAVGESLPKRVAVLATDDTGTGEWAAQDSGGASPITIERLSDPVEPMELSGMISRYLGKWEGSAERTLVCLHSLTVVLGRIGHRRTRRLIETLNARFDAVDATAHFHLDPTTLDERGLAEIRPLFDAVLEPPDEHGATDRGTGRGVDRAGVEATPDRAAPNTEAPTARDPPRLSHSFDTVIDLLRAPQRRVVLYYLVAMDEHEVTVDTLAEAVHRLRGSMTSIPADTTLQEIELSLLHVHLPKLAEYGIVEFDPETDVVRYVPNQLLHACVEHARRFEGVPAVGEQDTVE
jgi:hypothetical protein